MTSLDTKLLKIRDVFCLNPLNSDFIQPGSIPAVGSNGHLDWVSSVNFMTYIGAATVDNIVTFSSLSSFAVSTTLNLCSTVAGLGSLPNGHDYISSSKLSYFLNGMAITNGYVSSTTLYDTITNLGDMRQITDKIGVMVKFLSGVGSNLSGGYVSTINPGNYRIYKSTLGLGGGNLNQTLNDGATATSGSLDIGGFGNKIVGTSHLRVDINANITLGYSGSGPTNTSFSTFLVNPTTSQVVGAPVSLSFTGPNAMMTNLSFILKSSQLTPYPTTLQIRHRLINGQGSNATLVTQIPQSGGVFATLDNTD
jgi:hypothetical protein